MCNMTLTRSGKQDSKMGKGKKKEAALRFGAPWQMLWGTKFARKDRQASSFFPARLPSLVMLLVSVGVDIAHLMLSIGPVASWRL